MAQSFTTQSLQAVLGFPFRDPDWKNKLLIGSVLVLAGIFIPLVPIIFVYGLMAAVMRQAIAGEQPRLPAWDDWGRLGLDGLKWYGVSLIYSLPALVIGLLGMAAFMIIPLVPLWMSGETPPEALGPVVVGPMAAMAAGGAVFGLATLLSLVAGLLTPPAFAHVVATGRFGAAFHVRQWWPIFRANLGGFLLSYLIVMGVSLVLGMVVQILYFTVVLCCLAPVVMAPISVYTLLIQGALYGEAYRVGGGQIAQGDEGEPHVE